MELHLTSWTGSIFPKSSAAVDTGHINNTRICYINVWLSRLSSIEFFPHHWASNWASLSQLSAEFLTAKSSPAQAQDSPSSPSSTPPLISSSRQGSDKFYDLPCDCWWSLWIVFVLFEFVWKREVCAIINPAKIGMILKLPMLPESNQMLRECSRIVLYRF